MIEVGDEGVARPGNGDHSGTTTSTGGPPSTKRASSWPCPTASITERPARQEGQYCGISDQAWFSENRSVPTSTRSDPSRGWCPGAVTPARVSSVAGVERLDADEWVPSMHVGIGSEDAEGGFALRVVITSEFP
jgi:hypothetical protein